MRRLAAILIAATFLACGSESNQPWERYEIAGEVIELKSGNPPVAVIEHGDIEGFMNAMTMGFPLRDPEEFAKLYEGAKIRGSVVARGYTEYYLDDVEVLPAEAPVDAAP